MDTKTITNSNRQQASSWQQFEQLARTTMSREFETKFVEKNPNGFPKKFDFVSDEKGIVGDAKYLSLVKRAQTPPAKLMEITAHIWLLEKCQANVRFLVFGNQIEVINKWLKKYGSIQFDVRLYFLSDSNILERLR